MIIECPRCGFAQPKDRYCANCGLDIDHFKPVPEPKLKALAQNSALQVALVVIVVVATAGGIYSAQQKAVKEQLETAQKQETPNAAATPLSAPTAARGLIPPTHSAAPAAEAPIAKSARTAGTLAANPQATNAAAAEEVANENLALSEKTDGASPAAPAPSSAPKSLSIYFLEMPRDVVEQIAAENQVLNEYAGTRSILIASQPAPSGLGPNVILPGGSTRVLEAGKKIDMSFIDQDQLGMNLEIGHNYHNDNEFDLEVVGQVFLRDAENMIKNTGINGKYTIPKNATLFIVGMVAPQPVRAEDQANFGRTPLAIMGSPRFLSSQTQFVVLIQPK